MEPGRQYWLIVETVCDAISIYDGPNIFLKQFNSAALNARTLFAAHWCQSEVCNGGFQQFFENSTGVLAPEAAAAFRSIGMRQTGAIVEEAMQWFGRSYPRERGVREEALAEYEKDNPEQESPFEQLDEKFFELICSDNGGFETAADRYAKAGG